MKKRYKEGKKKGDKRRINNGIKMYEMKKRERIRNEE